MTHANHHHAAWSDFNDADAQQGEFNLIPKGTQALVRMAIKPGGHDDASKGWTGESKSTAVHGPFSQTFEWVHLPDWSSEPIRLTAAQAAIFGVLWRYQGQPQSAETIMSKAHLSSDKLIDVFKVKTANKGDPKYEGPMHVYEKLVVRNRRLGLYSLRLVA